MAWLRQMRGCGEVIHLWVTLIRVRIDVTLEIQAAYRPPPWRAISVAEFKPYSPSSMTDCWWIVCTQVSARVSELYRCNAIWEVMKSKPMPGPSPSPSPSRSRHQTFLLASSNLVSTLSCILLRCCCLALSRTSVLVYYTTSQISEVLLFEFAKRFCGQHFFLDSPMPSAGIAVSCRKLTAVEAEKPRCLVQTNSPTWKYPTSVLCQSCLIICT